MPIVIATDWPEQLAELKNETLTRAMELGLQEYRGQEIELAGHRVHLRASFRHQPQDKKPGSWVCEWFFDDVRRGYNHVMGRLRRSACGPKCEKYCALNCMKRESDFGKIS